MDSIRPTSQSLAWILCAIVLGGSIVGSTYLASNTFYRTKSLVNNLSVTGSYDKVVRSDTAKWVSTISRNVDVAKVNEGGTLIKQDAVETSKIFADHGIKPQELEISPLTMTAICETQESTTYDNNGARTCTGNKTTGYRLAQTITIQSSNVDAITKLAQETPEKILGKNILFTSQPIEYYYNALADIRLELLAQATDNARQRADAIAQSTGSKLGKIQSASVGVFQVTAKNSVDVSDYGAYDTSSLEKKVTAVVRTTFSLE